MRRISIIIGVMLPLLFASCGQQKEAEQLIEEFIDLNALTPAKIENRTFQKMDSTKNISDSLVIAMQERSHELFKESIEYPIKTSGRMLYFIRMNYTYEGDTLSQTFYIDESFKDIVAFK